jgi:cell division septation protein DedD
MSSGPRPGRPIMGQRPMFGGGSPVFARMPSYTPVTRGPDQGLPPQSEPSQPGAYPQGAQGYPNANSAPAQSYLSGNPAPARPYSGPQQSAPQAYPNGNGYPAQAYSGHGNPTHGYAGQGYPDQGYADRGQAGQGQPAQSYPSQGYRPESDASFNAGFADQNFGNANFPNASMPAGGYPAAGYREANFAPASGADASFPENGFTEDASFPEDAGYSGNGAYQHDEHNLEMPNGAYGQQAYQPGNEQARQGTMASQGGQYSQPDPHRAVQPFDAIYDQPPQIALGGTQAHRSPQSFYDGEQSDADFLDDPQAPVADAAVATRKLSIKGRSMFMVGSALLGAVALGGALAFAYKQSGGAMNGGEPPLVQADNRPVKEAPDQPAGKDLPHKNKLIYDRLESGDKPETDHLVPRQEDVAVPAMPASVDTAGLSAARAPDAPQMTEAVDTGTVPPGAVATVDDPEGGPRHVKTMVVRPDGSVVPPTAPGAAAAPAQAPAQVATAEAPMAAPAAQAPVQAHMAAAPPAPAAAAASEPQQVASIPPQAPAKPKPVKAAVAPAAAEDPAPKAAAPKSPSQFVVQVASKQNQTEALATFADMQQKYPTLLASYRPIVQKADLGTKGVWYRLRIGPINDKTVASKLCTQLKSQGLNDCLVMTE